MVVVVLEDNFITFVHMYIVDMTGHSMQKLYVIKKILYLKFEVVDCLININRNEVL